MFFSLFRHLIQLQIMILDQSIKCGWSPIYRIRSDPPMIGLFLMTTFKSWVSKLEGCGSIAICTTRILACPLQFLVIHPPLRFAIGSLVAIALGSTSLRMVVNLHLPVNIYASQLPPYFGLKSTFQDICPFSSPCVIITNHFFEGRWAKEVPTS